uniref:Uncharacterized protein n=1 Tax=viral metagenome TaxID=1070528 RepID=A0A6H1ZVD6_9ZZZZ
MSNELYKGEIGRIYGMRLIETPDGFELKIIPGIGNKYSVKAMRELLHTILSDVFVPVEAYEKKCDIKVEVGE